MDRVLQMHSKIVTRRQDGSFYLESDNLRRILSSYVENPCFTSVPVGVVSIVGPKQCGKSFYTNLLIQYFQHNKKGGWLAKLNSKKGGEQKPLTGFQYGAVVSSENITPEMTSSGIYLWPEPFLLSQCTGEKILVWVLDWNYVLDSGDAKEDLDSLEALLNLISSTMMEIRWKGDKCRIQEIQKGVLEWESIRPESICKNIVYLFRTSNSSKNLRDPAVLEHFKDVFETSIPDKMEPLQDEQGYLDINSDMHRKIEKCIREVAECVFSKQLVEGEHLTLSKMERFLAECVKLVNLECLKGNEHKCSNTTNVRTLVNEFSMPTPPEKCDPLSPPVSMNVESAEEPFSMALQDAKECAQGIDGLVENESKLYPDQQLLHPNAAVVVEDPVREQKMETNDGNNLFPRKRCGEGSESAEMATSGGYLTRSKVKEINAQRISKPDKDVDKKESNNNQHVAFGEQGKVEGEVESHDRDGGEVKKHKDLTLDDKANETVPSGQTDLKRRMEEEKAEKIKQQEADLWQKEETEKMQLEELLKDALKRFKILVLKRLNQWVKNLTIQTIHECTKRSYDDSVPEIARYYTTVLPKFKEIFINEVKPQKEGIVKLETRVANYNVDVNNVFHKYYCIPEDTLDEILSLKLQRAIKSLDEENTGIYVTKACNKLAQCYKEHNKSVYLSELKLAQEAGSALRKIYNGEMEKLLNEDQLYCPVTLETIHSDLREECLNALEMTTAFTKGIKNIALNDAYEELRNQLNEDFKTIHWPEYQNRLNILQRKVTQLIKHFKSVYETEMDSTLQKCPEGMDATALEKVQEKIQLDVMGLLKIEIRNNIGVDEPVQVHIKTLQTYLNKAWQGFKDENMDKLKNRPKEENPNDKRRPSCDGAAQLGHDQVLPPLIVHFSLKKLTVAKMEWNRHGKITYSGGLEKGQQIPTVVCLTKTDAWIAGVEAVERINYEGYNNLQAIWSVSEHFASTPFPWHEDIHIRESTHKITVEFLLGYLFHTLKDNVELELNAKAEDVLFLVPFWFPSSHRLQIKLGATIAGFTRVSLVNENSAAAYGLAVNRDPNPYSDIIVLSENSGYVGVTKFSYECYNEILKMKHHCNAEPHKTEDDEAVRQVLATYKQMENELSYYGMRRHHSIDVLILCESDRWKQVLFQVARKMHAYNVRIVEQELIAGAELLNQSMSEIGEYVKDLLSYDIVRMHKVNHEVEVGVKYFNLPPVKREVTVSLPIKVKESLFYQSGVSCQIAPIGQLVGTRIKSEYQIEPIFEITNEGIVTLNRVQLKKKGYMYGCSYFQAENNDYAWATPHPDEGQLAIFASLMNVLKTTKVEESKKCQIKAELMQKGTDLQKRLLAGEGNIKSSLGREMVLKQIKKAMDTSNRPNCSLDDVKKQMEFLNKLKQKHLPQL